MAKILGLSQKNSVRVYRQRYDDFPHPVVDMGAGRCLLWLRQEVEAWQEERHHRTTTTAQASFRIVKK